MKETPSAAPLFPFFWKGRPWFPALVGALCALGLFLIFISYAQPGGLFAPPQPDTLLYAQYARAIAEAHPYQCQPGDGCSTGSTSHLYPFVLALPGLLGGTAATYLIWSFLLNLCSYLAIIALSGVILRRLAPAAAPLGMTLVALSGPLALSCLQQSDMGLFTLLTLALVAVLLTERLGWAVALMALVVWCRPEGMMFAGLFFLCALVARGWPRRRACLALGAWGLANAAGVLALNLALTGTVAFQSVATKGYFVNLPFAGAVFATLTDLGVLLREYVLSLPSSGRQPYQFPLLGGLLLLLALGARLPARAAATRFVERWLALALLAGLVLMAASGWQGFNYDRHLTWALPLVLIYTAAGLAWLAERWPGGNAAWRCLAGVLLVYEAAMLPLYAAQYSSTLQQTAMQDAFISAVDAALPPGQRVGVVSNGGAATFLMPKRHVTHISGYLSPEFVTGKETWANIEVLRHNPEQRFDVWLLSRDKLETPALKALIGPQLMEDTAYLPAQAAFVCRQADWSSLVSPEQPLAATTARAVADWRLVDRLDVGYLPDERAHAYAVFTRFGHTALRVGAATRLIDGRAVTEAGRVIMGAESFRVKVSPGLPLRMVLRTAATLPVDVCTFGGAIANAAVSFNPDSRLNILVDDLPASACAAPIGTNETVWSELVLDLPAASITRARTEITVAGDHVAMCYWFYQPDPALRVEPAARAASASR